MVTRWQQRRMPFWRITKVTKAWSLRLIAFLEHRSGRREHFIAVVFGRPNFMEVAFARFKIVDGLGCSIVYSHRIYGEKIGDQMSAWLKDKGAEKEKALMEWNDIPSPASLGRDRPRKGGLPSGANASPSKR
jgi:hypothetical protein